jgi:hypothetical protein
MPCTCQPLLTLDRHGQWHGDILICSAHTALSFLFQELLGYHQQDLPIPDSFWPNAERLYDELYSPDDSVPS